jgi:hypothetical protein
MIRKFLLQPARAYRNFQVVYSVLALQFLIPSLTYLIAPELALETVHQVSDLLGAPYPFSEESHVWRMLAFSDVWTLGSMCLILQLNLRRWYPVLLPLLICKGSSVVGSAYIYVFQEAHPFLLVVVLLDSLTVWVMWYFASRARRECGEEIVHSWIPRPRFAADGSF